MTPEEFQQERDARIAQDEQDAPEEMRDYLEMEKEIRGE